MDDLRKNKLDPSRPPKSSHLKQLQAHNVPSDDKENTNGSN